jgi:hypothetical protein
MPERRGPAIPAEALRRENLYEHADSIEMVKALPGWPRDRAEAGI